MSKVKIVRNHNQTKVSIPLTNVPLFIFYIIVIILLWLFLHQVIEIDNNPSDNQYGIGIGALLTTVILLYIIKSLLGKATVTFESGEVHIYEGVLGIGRRKEFLISEVENIFIFRKVSRGGTNNGRPYPGSIEQHIVFQTHQNIKFLQNRTSIYDLKELCEVLEVELRNHK